MRRFAGRSCAVVSLSLNRGRRPPEAEKRARRFSASLLDRKVPRSLLDGVSRPRRPRLRGKSAEERVSREARTSNHRRTRPAPRGKRQFSRQWGFRSHKPLGAGIAELERRFETRTQAQNAAPARVGSTTKLGRIRGHLSHDAPTRAGAGCGLFLGRFETRLTAPARSLLNPRPNPPTTENHHRTHHTRREPQNPAASVSRLAAGHLD